jgi:hypothetical protein
VDDPGLETERAAPPASVRGDVARGARAGLCTFVTLAKAMIPAYFVALLLRETGAIAVLARVAEPVMDPLGLPGSAAVPLVIGYVLNIYGAVGAMTALDLDARQVTVLSLAILIGHNLLVEGAVLRRTGMNPLGFGALRIVSGLAAGAVANLVMAALG